MSDFKPTLPYMTPVYILIPEYKTIKGVTKKVYPEPTDDRIIFCSFKTFGGTETEKNGLLSVIDTGNVETWYRPDIKSDCRIMFPDIGAVYEVIGEPENINMRNQWTRFKVQRVKGGV